MKYLYISLIILSVTQAHAGKWSASLKINQIQSDLSHNYNPVLTFLGPIGSGCQHDIYGQISKDIPEYKDMISLSMMAMASGKEVRVYTSGCEINGYAKINGINVKN